MTLDEFREKTKDLPGYTKLIIPAEERDDEYWDIFDVEELTVYMYPEFPNVWDPRNSYSDHNVWFNNPSIPALLLR